MSVQSVPTEAEAEDESNDELTEEERLLASIPEEYRDELSAEVEQPAASDASVEPASTPAPADVDQPTDTPELDPTAEPDVGDESNDNDEDPAEEVTPEADSEPEPESGAEAEAEAEAEDGDEATVEDEVEDESSELGHNRNLPLRSGSVSLPARVYGSFVDNMTTFHSEGRLVFSDSGVNMSAPDKSNVCMTDSTLKPEAFESFAAPETEIGIDLEKTKDALNVFDAGSEITLSHDEETHQQSLGDDNLSFDFSLISLGYLDEPAEIPDFAYTVSFTISTAEFKQMIKAADMVGDTLVFAADENSQCITLSAEGDTDEVDKAFGHDDVDINNISDAVSMYSLDYLKPIKKTLKGTDEVTVEYAENFPIRVAFEQHDGALETEFLVAPKIPSDS